MGRWFNLHSHSHYSCLDGTTRVPDLVGKASLLGYPALGLTDHGNMSGATKLYKSCKEYGILPFPGVEAYLIDPFSQVDLDDKLTGKVKRYHIGLHAYTTRGYQGLVKLTSLSHTRPRFNRFPRVTIDDLRDLGGNYGDDVALTTGCHFGWLQQTLVNEGEGGAEQVLDELAFLGFAETFVELQHHNIEHQDAPGLDDEELMRRTYSLAVKAGLPVIATQDCHYLDQKHKRAHAMMKRMVYGGAEDEFPGDAFHLATEGWVAEHYPPDVWEQVLRTCDQLVYKHDVHIDQLDHYEPDLPPSPTRRHLYLPMVQTMETDHEVLVRLCWDRIGGSVDARYRDRLNYELDVIEKVGMAGYFLHVEDYVAWCKQESICIEARGSANSSFVCYLLGITQVDPVKWGLLFSRFLSEDRIKPPDIDMDIEDSQRGRLLSYIELRYDSARIGTFGLLGTNAEGQGSVFRTYVTHRAKKATTEEGRRRAYATYQSLDDVAQRHPADHRALQQLAQMNSVYKSYGVHAAGVLLSGVNTKIRDWVPTMLVASSNTHVTQYDMHDVEEWGLLKDDILGQASLSVMRLCQSHIGRGDPTDFTWIPDDDKQACKLLREGRTDTGIFHFEGFHLYQEEPVLTPSGWIKIKDLKLGDLVVDPDGGAAKVEGVYPGERQQVYRVELTDGSSVEVSATHLWNYTVNGGSVQLGSTAELRHMLDTTTYCPSLVGFTPTDLEHPDPRPVDPYVLGLFLGDGCLTNPHLVRLINSDGLHQAVVAAYPGLVVQQEPDSERYYFRAPTKRGPNPLKDGLRDLGLMGLDAGGKFVPEQYLWAPVADRLALLQGLLDTDGCAHLNGEIRYSTVSLRLMEAIKFLVYSLGGKCRVTEQDRGRMHVAVQESGTRPIHIVGSIQLDQAPFRLPRKLARWTTTTRRTGYGIKSITPTRVADVVCIGTSSASECFITRDWMVTHNTKSRGGRELGIRYTKDAVLAQALFMPGAMNTGQKDLYIERKRDAEKRGAVTYLHKAFEKALRPTYGAVIYQEQVLQIMRNLGMSIPSINKFFKIVKDSGRGATARNQERLDEVRDEFDQHCLDAGIPSEDLDEAWAQTAGFIEYGFNKGHATGYGVRSYRTAYLKAHYPLEYMAALLAVWAGTDKEKLYEREARYMGLPILGPDVNMSGATWTLDRTKGIRRGLLSIKGVGAGCAEEIARHAPYLGPIDLALRCDARKVSGCKDWLDKGVLGGRLEILVQAGALTSIGMDRRIK